MSKPTLEQIVNTLDCYYDLEARQNRFAAQAILDMWPDDAARIKELEADNRSAAKDLAELINYKNEQAKIIATLTAQRHPLIKCPRCEKETQPDTAHTCKIGCNR